jgi:hypothetical protein
MKSGTHKPGNSLPNHGTDMLLFVGSEDSDTPRSVQKDAGVDRVEVEAKWHVPQTLLGVNESVYHAEEALCGVESFVDEACVADSANVIIEDLDNFRQQSQKCKSYDASLTRPGAECLRPS